MSALDTRRARIRAALTEQVKTMADLVSAAASRLDAPDPESALVYLWQLHQALEEGVGALDRRGLERRIARRAA